MPMRKILTIAALVLFIASVTALAGDKKTVSIPDELVTKTDQLTPTINPVPDPDDVSISGNGNGGVVKENVRDRIYDQSDVNTRLDTGTGPGTASRTRPEYWRCWLQ